MTGDAFHELTLEAGPLRLAARASGPAEGRPVLALHGWLDNAASFEALAPLLPGIRLVALELPGHGSSDHRPPGCAYHFLDYVGDVLAAADALGWRRFSLLGHSLGGAVATLVAAARPQRIERVALIDSLGPLSEAPAHAPQRLAQALAFRQRGYRPPRRYANLEEAVDARRAAGGLSPSSARLLVERATIGDETGLRWRSDPRLRWPSPYRLTEDQVLACLAAVRAATLVIAAEDGHLPPDDPVTRRRLETVPNARLNRVPGNHHLHMENAARVAALVRPFLTGE